MVGPIGIGVMNALVRLRCPHCGTTQVRARGSHGAAPTYRVCSRCHRHFDERAAAAAAKAKKAPSKRR
jgi:transposase-like protein